MKQLDCRMSALRPARIAIIALIALVATACRDGGVGPGDDPTEQLLFLSSRDGAVDNFGRPIDDVYLTDPDGTTVAQNLSREPGRYHHLSVSPDGLRILYSATCDIWVRNADWSSPLKLTNRNGGFSERCNGQPRWSRDGARIAFATNRDNRSEGTTSGLYDVYVMNADGSNPRKVSTDIPADVSFSIGVIGWSPGGQVVFQTSDVVNGDMYRRVYLVNADGTALRPLFATSVDLNPAWSPDGSKIVFNRWQGGREKLYIMNADGSGPRELTTSTGFDRLDGADGGLIGTMSYSPWSPDGTRIVFLRSDGTDNSTLFVINADGSGLRRLTPPGSSFNGWSALGSKIAFTTAPFGSPTDVYAINADGTGLMNLTSHPSHDWQALWILKR